ncbi:unnamed protein product [Diabrotica balteata]|uniref:Serine hydrolase domain-containing protein n=1 Tax=Diabrotica balteata TaxID=107213 RepID=A0A9N9XHD9_DIABA|nr:unnamed protein product [Diabrotica balteata]
MNHENTEPQKCCPNNNMKLKILAIHGYRQNAETFRSKTGSFRKMIHKWAEFTYITAPHKVILVDDPNDLEKNGPDIGQSKDEEMSEALSNCFEEPVIVRHPGGHYLPAAAPQKSDYQKFIKLQLLKKQFNAV